MWADKSKLTQLLFVLCCVLVVFIPLFPKLPLLDAIPGYLVKIRVEDIIVGLTSLVWLTIFWQAKNKSLASYSWLILLFSVLGVTSLVVSLFFTHTIPWQFVHLAKSGLHYIRYIEYFALFLFAYTGLTNLKQLRIVEVLLAITVILASLYGFGQKYWQWPVFSTMNREYAKGWSLTLSPDARVQSTFGGPYDMTAYLVIVLPLLLSFLCKQILTSWQTKRMMWQDAFAFTYLIAAQLAGWWLLMAGASKISFIAFIVSYLLIGWQYLLQLKLSTKQLWRWGMAGLVSFTMLVIISLVTFGDSMLNRFWQISQDLPIIQNLLPSNEEVNKPADLTYDAPQIQKQTNINEYGEKIEEITYSDSNWSANALKYGVSMGIRLDTLWPQAMRGFWRNILFGAGFGNLNKGGDEQFTEADSTDNNYLRTLGENGLLGWLAFYAIVILAIKDTWSQKNAWSIGYIAGAVGLLINALYIDVFAASKVAFSFWLLTGLAIKNLHLESSTALANDKKRITKWQKIIKSHLGFIVVYLVFFGLTYRNPFNNDSLLIAKYGNLLTNYPVLATQIGGNLFELYNLPYVMLLKFFRIFWPSLFNFYVINLALMSMSLWLTYKWFNQKFSQHQTIIWLLLLVFLLPVRQLVFQPTATILYLFLASLLLTKIRWPQKIGKIIKNDLISNGVTVLLGLLCFITIWQNKHFWLNDNIVDRSVWYYQSIKIAQQSLPFTNENNIVISTLPEKLVNVLKNSQWNYYQLTNNYQHDFRLINDWLAQNKNVFLSNYELAEPANKQQWHQILSEYHLQLINRGCLDNCSLLSLNKAITVPGYQTPQTWENRAIDLQSNPLDIVILPHTFHTYGTTNRLPYTTHQLIRKMSKLANLKTDLLFFVGDVGDQPSKDRINLMNNFFTQLSFPVINIANSNNELLTTPSNQSFLWHTTYFITIQHGDEDLPSATLADFLTNQLLTLEHLGDKISEVVIISYAPLLTNGQENNTQIVFQRNFWSQLQQSDLTNVPITLISGQLGADASMSQFSSNNYGRYKVIETGNGNMPNMPLQFLHGVYNLQTTRYDWQLKN